MPRPLYLRERPGTHCTGGWVGPRVGLDVCGKSRPHRDEYLTVFCVTWSYPTLSFANIYKFYILIIIMGCHAIYEYNEHRNYT